ncbi:MAG: non-heme iron oxygenase ferredoxin subunit [Planctomycetales bacterium]|nr:non-heme iron oxygenase ferredoxin subunit [Planctomycetales bacterium]
MSDFIPVAKLQALPTEGKLCLEIEGRFVVIVRLGSSVYCLDDVCTHDGGTLGDGQLIDGCLECPRHGARFDVCSGEAVCMPATEPTQNHEVKLEDDTIWVKLADG